MPTVTTITDETVRAAAHARVRALRDTFGGRIPASALEEGINLAGRRIPIWNRYKGIFKPAATGPLAAALSVQTSAASPYGDRHDLDNATITYKYRGTDPTHADNVALRRAMQLGLPIIYLVAVDPGFYDVITPVYVTNDSVADLNFTLNADQAAYVGAADDVAHTVLRRAYATRAVLQRLHQQQFRRLVLNAYRNQCSICHLRHIELLDAAHILPDRDPRGDPVVSNGLGLCKIHHSAYDANIIGIDPDAIVHVRTDILLEVDGPMLKHGLQDVDGWKLALPRTGDHRPNRDHLAERFDRFRAA
jgi:putative restriction endonuclease